MNARGEKGIKRKLGLLELAKQQVEVSQPARSWLQPGHFLPAQGAL